MTRNKTIVSLILKSFICLLVIAGVTSNYFVGLIGKKECFLYFTTQSNLLIGIVDLVMIYFLVRNLQKENYILHKSMTIIHLLSTVSITLTGIIYCFVLMPASFFAHMEIEYENELFYIPAIILHMIIPVLAIVDFLVTTRTKNLNYIDSLYGTIPPLFYLFFSMALFYMNVDFGKGDNFPYFFLNYSSPAGFFGFSSTAPYFIGSFYWYLIILSIVTGFSLILVYIVKKLSNRSTVFKK